jgi:tetratricopeptide (TPR) repeat protein
MSMGRQLATGFVVMLLATAGGCRAERSLEKDLPPLTRSLFEIERDLGPSASSDGPRHLRDVVTAARGALAREPARGPAVALGEAIFQTSGFIREVDDPDLRYVFISSVLETHRGSCVGLGTLFLAVAELAGVRARGVMVPGHFYVQVEEGDRWRNVELLRRGEEMPDTWYRSRYGAPAGSVAGTPLEPAQVQGVVAYDVGNERRREGRVTEARRAYERAARALPAFAEAQASLGAALHLAGALDEAATAYQKARNLEPNLPGLARNIELLDAERERRP